MKKIAQERFYYIANTVWWEGQINATDLIRQFQISRDSASSILKSYDRHFPDNLVYDRSRKARVMSNKFKPFNDVGRFDVYLRLAQKKLMYT